MPLNMHRLSKTVLFSKTCMTALSLIFLAFGFCLNSQAQTIHDFGSWFSLNTQGKVNRCNDESRLLWWFDGHLRYLDDTEGFHQSIFRPGVGYQLTPNTNLWAGYGWINTLSNGATELRDEHRIWQQFMWSPKFENCSFIWRSRFEQRFLETGDDMGLRFRQFFKVDRPFHCNSPFSFVAWNETFLDLNETDWGQQGRLGQNRLFFNGIVLQVRKQAVEFTPVGQGVFELDFHVVFSRIPGWCCCVLRDNGGKRPADLTKCRSEQ